MDELHKNILFIIYLLRFMALAISVSMYFLRSINLLAFILFLSRLKSF